MMAATSENTVQVEKNPPKKPDKKKTKYDVIIIGAGPAGYTLKTIRALQKESWDLIL